MIFLKLFIKKVLIIIKEYNIFVIYYFKYIKYKKLYIWFDIIFIKIIVIVKNKR